MLVESFQAKVRGSVGREEVEAVREDAAEFWQRLVILVVNRRGREMTVGVMVLVHREADLSEIVPTLQFVRGCIAAGHFFAAVRVVPFRLLGVVRQPGNGLTHGRVGRSGWAGLQ